MFILGIIFDIVDDLTRLRYEHDLAVCYIVRGVGNHVGLLIEPPFIVVQVGRWLRSIKQAKGV